MVLEATDRRSGEQLCAKMLPKFTHNRLPGQQLALVAAEAEAQRVLGAACPGSILRLVDVRQCSNCFYLISEVRGREGWAGRAGWAMEGREGGGGGSGINHFHPPGCWQQLTSVGGTRMVAAAPCMAHSTTLPQFTVWHLPAPA